MADAPSGATQAYDRDMKLVTGTVIEGKVVLEGAALPDGTTVTVLVDDADVPTRLPPNLLAELNEALDEADREEGISAEEMINKIRKYG